MPSSSPRVAAPDDVAPDDSVVAEPPPLSFDEAPVSADYEPRGATSLDLSDDKPSALGQKAATESGIPGRGILLCSALATAGCAAADYALTGGLTIFFDLWFVVISLVGAMSVVRRDLFTVGVLPPLLMATIAAMIAILEPAVFVTSGSFSESFLTGLAEHAVGLVAGYGAALLVLVCRIPSARTSS
ncbi:MAG: DUF6542 domain-containing protein [Nocardioidaceae bacterium]